MFENNKKAIHDRVVMLCALAFGNVANLKCERKLHCCIDVNKARVNEHVWNDTLQLILLSFAFNNSLPQTIQNSL
ncbi:CLUMA_CG017067, isoform A [Clunio marinus]|uniref:CLUMA_CG017067, isoform A n=1 Tax=Clunio marinus TaxID=568069 RepID=A0A1J1IW71_9DIPT|nr:CLUMA_CG017067, isoform A [Clunio marinus]